MRAQPTAVSPRIALVAVAAVSVLGVLPVFMFGALFVTIRDDVPLQLGQLGLLVSAFYAVAAISSIPAGIVCERLGPARALRVSALTSALALAGLGTVRTGALELVVWMVVGGLGDALSKPASNLGLASLPPMRKLGLVFGIKQSAIPAATIVAGAAVPLLALVVGWRVAFYVLGAAVLVGSLIAVRRSGLPVDGVARPAGTPRSGIRWDVPLLLLVLSAALGVSAGPILNAFYVESAVAGGLSASAAGTALAVCGAVAVVARLLGGVWVDRHRQAIGFGTIGWMMLFGAGAVALLGLASTPVLFLVASVLAFSAAWGWNGIFHYVLVHRYAHAPAAATGVVSLGIFGGATLGPAAFGVLASGDLREVGWYLLAAFLTVAAAGLWTVERLQSQRVAVGRDRTVGSVRGERT